MHHLGRHLLLLNYAYNLCISSDIAEIHLAHTQAVQLLIPRSSFNSLSLVFPFSFADWYVPNERWEQGLLQEETIGNDFINVDSPQPAADDVLLCTAMVPVSPFGSLNWVKVPCDYPMFISGLICEKPAKSKCNS